MDTVAQSADGTIYGERFQCVKTLKVGRGTATLLGRDLYRGNPVVIKTAVALTPEARLRLEHEAGVLSDLAGPDVPPVLAFGHMCDTTYVVMPFVPGVTLRERLIRGALSLQETLVVGRALAHALARAHERGIFHRDIKPGNIMVDEGGAFSRATLIDFGFSRDPSIRDIPIGAVHYLAPEQAGLLSRPVDERADLYAAGITLFECVAGGVPFPGQSVGEVLRAHLCVQQPELRGMGCGVPRALDEIIQRLLRKDPDDRYQTAGALLADLIALDDALAQGASEPVVAVGWCDRRRTLAEPAFVGREEELARLDRRFARVWDGGGGLVLLEAESGCGKTRLLDEFAGRCAGAGAWVLRGQAVARTGIRPFHLLDGVIHALVGHVESNPAFGERLRDILGDQREAVCEAVPLLAACLDPRTSPSPGQEAHGEVRSLRALSALLHALGRRDRPAVILLDDAQWADEQTLKCLESPAAVGHVLVVVAFRRAGGSADHRLRGLPHTETLALAPLSAADLRRLSESMAGRLPDEAVDLVVRLAEGSPLMAIAVLQAAVEIGGLVPGGSGDAKSETTTWRVDPHAMEDIRSARRLDVLLSRRLARLPPVSIKLLSAGAVMGKEFALVSAGEVSGLPEHEWAPGCREAARRHLIRIHENGARCVLVHDTIREALLARLPDDERRALHAGAAATIEAEDRTRVFDLADHFEAAGQSERALPYAMAAAEQARARYALAVAERQYRIAERAATSADSHVRLRLWQGLGDVLMLLGRYEEAGKRFQAARSVALARDAHEEGEAKQVAAKAESQLIASSVAGFAHAIKNPVAVLRAYLGLLRDAPEQGAGIVDRYLLAMEGAVDRIGELVRHLQRVQVTASQKATISLARLIADAMAEVRPLFSAERGYRVECEVASDAPTHIVADGEQLRLVIVNLLVNANQSMPHGGCVRIGVRSDGGGGVEIDITDEGAGISPAIEPRLFEPFVTSKPEGTGLGLWVCRNIVEEEHQGRIRVTGGPGGGTSVSVMLPVQ